MARATAKRRPASSRTEHERQVERRVAVRDYPIAAATLQDCKKEFPTSVWVTTTDAVAVVRNAVTSAVFDGAEPSAVIPGRATTTGRVVRTRSDTVLVRVVPCHSQSIDLGSARDRKTAEIGALDRNPLFAPPLHRSGGWDRRDSGTARPKPLFRRGIAVSALSQLCPKLSRCATGRRAGAGRACHCAACRGLRSSPHPGFTRNFGACAFYTCVA
jgi:hypothetical protein